MNRFKNYVLMAAGFGMLSVLAGIFSAGPAIAQAVRAALVSNVDDPGRIPYQSQRACIFSSGSCVVSFPPVPDGKRLVITHVSGSLQDTLPGGTLVLGNLSSFGTSIAITVTFTGSSGGSNYFTFDQSALLFYDARLHPEVTMTVGAFGQPSNSFASFTLTGYMLDCTTGPCAAIVP